MFQVNPPIQLKLDGYTKKEGATIDKLVHSSSSFVMVQEELLLCEITDRMNEILVCGDHGPGQL